MGNFTLYNINFLYMLYTGAMLAAQSPVMFQYCRQWAVYCIMYDTVAEIHNTYGFLIVINFIASNYTIIICSIDRIVTSDFGKFSWLPLLH